MTQPQLFLKRVLDITFSSIGLILTWPIIIICILVARFDGGGSGLFSQTRIGKNGKVFRIYKIQTMAQELFDSQSTITVENDPRITRSGAILRKYKLDELPQLWNVLMGDMSLVGPRPDVKGYADKLTGEYRQVLRVSPGITGPASIKYHQEETLLASVDNPIEYNDNVIFPDKCRINTAYINNWSLWGDIRYILMTVGLIKKPSTLELNRE